MSEPDMLLLYIYLGIILKLDCMQANTRNLSGYHIS